MRFKIEWASLLFGSKFTVFALFYFVFEGNFPSTSPRGAYNWRGDLREGFLRYWFEGLISGGAYTWRGLFSEFYGELHIITSFSGSEFCFPLAKLTHSLLCLTETWKKRIPMEYQMTLLMSGL